MKTRISFGIAVFTLLVAMRINADFAPENIDGMVLRMNFSFVGTDRTAHQTTVIFSQGETYILLGRTLFLIDMDRYRLSGVSVPLVKKPYTYMKTGADTAIWYTDPDVPHTLNFKSPTTGGDSSFAFSLTKMLTSESAPAMNISMRGEVRPNRPLICGFVVPQFGSSPEGDLYGNNAREVLIRVVGPSLAEFDVGDLWADPDFGLFRNGNPYQQAWLLTEVDYYGDWWTSYMSSGTEVISGQVSALERIFDQVGAFPLLERSKDAVQVERLPAGAYTVVAQAEEGDPGGEALIEVYFLP